MSVAGERLPSFPTFDGSSAFGGTTFPYTMVGRDPARGGEVDVDTSLIVTSFSFEELEVGDPIELYPIR